jgi:hypothetical protein
VSDRFNGITIDSTTELCEEAEFDGVLSSKFYFTMTSKVFSDELNCIICRISSVLERGKATCDLVSRASQPSSVVAIFSEK